MSLINDPRTSSSDGQSTGKKYWRSLNQLADTPEFREWVHHEFPANATEMLDGNSRRTVLKLMAASFGLAGLAACRRPVEHICFPIPPAPKPITICRASRSTYATVDVDGRACDGLAGRDARRAAYEDRRQSGSSAQSGRGYGDPAGHRFWACTIRTVPRRFCRAAKNRHGRRFEGAVQKLSLGDGAGLRFLSEIRVVAVAGVAARGCAEEVSEGEVGGVRGDFARQRTRGHAAWRSASRCIAHPHFDKAKVDGGAGSRFPGTGCAGAVLHDEAVFEAPQGRSRKKISTR